MLQIELQNLQAELLRLRNEGQRGEMLLVCRDGEPLLQLLKPSLSPYYAAGPLEGPGLNDPRLNFNDRTFWVTRSWWFNTIIHLRALHQWAVWGPIEPGKIVMAPWPPEKVTAAKPSFSMTR